MTVMIRSSESLFDGTGYGTDGTIWGGEILLADYGNFTRFGSITPFLQMGGDASAKEGWRIAVSMIYGYTKDRKRAWEIMETLGLCSEQESRVQFTMADRKINAVASTSAGRLFDAVSAILGIRRRSGFEGEASTALQFAAEAYEQQNLSKYLTGAKRKIRIYCCMKQKSVFVLKYTDVGAADYRSKNAGRRHRDAGISVSSGTGRNDYSCLYQSKRKQWQG